ncbi:LppX_LprAFG lipoprotein [Sphaerimonospora cavernae]|uniref:LppX_LprAFG lipoprotein n=1 Tax=Sphaerimonospora cavernae TaxID=1740611 RepID=A0ABV6TX66_9ACTN
MTRILGLVVAALLLVTACASNGTVALPDGPGLLEKSAEAMQAVRTVAFVIETRDRPAVPVRHAEGTLTKEGDARGTLQVELVGLQEFEFVITGDTVRFKGPTGGFQTMTRQQLAAIYDPSVVLTGVPELLSSANEARTEAAEKVGGVDAYRIAATLPQQSLAKLVPGIAQAVDGTLWIDRATDRLLKIELPLSGGGVTVTLDDYDAPVTITPPAS